MMCLSSLGFSDFVLSLMILSSDAQEQQPGCKSEVIQTLGDSSSNDH